ncbi:hypothetical protein DPMN_027908 [Dreissena polymorpha]|uniref:Uncharacterized protein n=1 Tax=Dreissena polymorpha TaxID=45954 RepID=A0A9D4LTQ8_DREPO|nr:hypothetical protein DPMN_027908 [Dreissena polymorpha]
MIGIVPCAVPPQVSVAVKVKVTVVPDRSEIGKLVVSVVVVTDPKQKLYMIVVP